MKTKLFLAAGLLAGLVLVATAVPADEPADPSAPALIPVLYGPNVKICHYPPGKNSKGSARSRTGKVLELSLSVYDYEYLCDIEDADDDRSAAASTDAARPGDVSAPGREVDPGFCPASQDAYHAEIESHRFDHERDCWTDDLDFDCSVPCVVPGANDKCYLEC